MSVFVECRSVLVYEFGDEKDVLGAGKDGEGEDGRVDRREVVAGAVGKAGGEDDQPDSYDLDESVDFPVDSLKLRNR